MENCIFCKIIKGEILCYKIYEDDYTFAFLDITNNPEGHTLVVPKAHSKNMLNASSEDIKRVFETVQKISKHYVDTKYAEGINVYVNNEECAGQEVMHLHVHILPRHKNDNIDFNRPNAQSNKPLEEVAKILKLNF